MKRNMGETAMTSRIRPTIALCLALSPLALTACAPAPLYTSSGLHRGAATLGEIPRDARGEPVWAAIRPYAPRDSFRPEMAASPSSRPAELQEGDGEDRPTPPRA